MRLSNLINNDWESLDSDQKEINTYVNNLTKVAKNKYKVDMGPLFTFRKDGSAIRLEPNQPAFEAIERSRELELEQIKVNVADKISTLDKNSVTEDIGSIETSSPVKAESGTSIVPKGLPSIKLTC